LPTPNAKKKFVIPAAANSLRVVPKPIARRKTRKSVAKRFKITGRGKILRAQSSRRHLLSAKKAKRKRQLGKAARVDKTDEARIRSNLPFA
jgi:large subunit ribosomal protein L35